MLFSILIVLIIIAGFFFFLGLFLIGIRVFFEETKEKIKEGDILLSITGISALVLCLLCLGAFCYISYEVFISALENLF